jgi:hypothetical protein
VDVTIFLLRRGFADLLDWECCRNRDDQLPGGDRGSDLGHGVGRGGGGHDSACARGVADPAAGVAAELGILAFKQAHTAWLAEHNHQKLSELTRAALDGLRATITELG